MGTKVPPLIQFSRKTNYKWQEENIDRQARGERFLSMAESNRRSLSPKCGRDNNRQPKNGGQGCGRKRSRERSRDGHDRMSWDDMCSAPRRPPRDNDRGHNRSRRNQSRGCDQSRGRDRRNDHGRNHSRNAHSLVEDCDKSRSCLHKEYGVSVLCHALIHDPGDLTPTMTTPTLLMMVLMMWPLQQYP